MLKPIHRVNCSPALAACQQLMRHFALWLCEAAVQGTDVTSDNMKAQMPSVIEGEWLWTLIAGKTGNKRLLTYAQTISNLPAHEKQGLAQWMQAVSSLPLHFSEAPPAALPVVPPNQWTARGASWSAFKSLMVAFYEDGLRDGLPYQSNGTPTNNIALRVTHQQFTHEFRQVHRLDPHPDARDVCVLCGGEVKQPDVDHWVGKGAFPLLAVCADNLLPICGECNEAPQKGQKPVHTGGHFNEWFHPYLAHANGALLLRYDDASLSILVESNDPLHAPKVRNLDALLNLTERWTREFKAEYRRLQREIEQTQAQKGPWAMAGLQQRLTDYRGNLSPAEPHHDVHQRLAEALLTPVRLAAFLP